MTGCRQRDAAPEQGVRPVRRAAVARRSACSRCSSCPGTVSKAAGRAVARWSRPACGPPLAAVRWQLLPLALPPLAGLAGGPQPRPRLLVAAGWRGLVWLAARGLRHRRKAGPSPGYGLFGPGPVQPALGWGALVYALACLMLLAYGLARLGWCKGDVFVVGAILLVGGVDRAVRVLSGALHPARPRSATTTARFAPRAVRRQAVQPLDLEPRLPLRRPQLRRGMEHRGAGRRWSACSPRCSASPSRWSRCARACR